MDIQERISGRNVTLLLSGEADHHGVRGALLKIDQIIDTALPRNLTLDLGGVTFMDSSGIALILRSRQKMSLLDGNIQVKNIPTQARRVLDAAGINRIVSMKN